MRLSLLFCAALAACIPHSEPHAVVAEAFTTEEREALERAAAKWNTIVREPVRLDGGEWHIVKATPPDYITKGYIGETDHPGRTVYLMPGMSETQFYAVALHELGHVVGLHHVQGDHSVMRAALSGATEFSAEDLEECRTVGACGLSPVEEAKCRLQGACGDYPR